MIASLGKSTIEGIRSGTNRKGTRGRESDGTGAVKTIAIAIEPPPVITGRGQSLSKSRGRSARVDRTRTRSRSHKRSRSHATARTTTRSRSAQNHRRDRSRSRSRSHRKSRRHDDRDRGDSRSRGRRSRSVSRRPLKPPDTPPQPSNVPDQVTMGLAKAAVAKLNVPIMSLEKIVAHVAFSLCPEILRKDRRPRSNTRMGLYTPAPPHPKPSRP